MTGWDGDGRKEACTHADAQARSQRIEGGRALPGRKHLRVDDGPAGLGGRARRLRRGRWKLLRWAPGNKGGESETVLGAWIAARRNRQAIVMATKVCGPMGAGPNDAGLSRQHIMHGVEASLKRLQTDYIDLYQAHTSTSVTSRTSASSRTPRSAAAFCPASPPSTARAAGVQKAYMTERGFAAWSYSSTPRRARRSTKRARGERHDGSLASATVTHVTTATAPDHSARVRLDAAFPSAVADARSGGDDRRQRGARPGRETRRFRSRRPGRPEAAGPACLARTRNADRSLDSVRSIRTAPPSILAHHLRGESTFATAYTSDT